MTPLTILIAMINVYINNQPEMIRIINNHTLR